MINHRDHSARIRAFGWGRPRILNDILGFHRDNDVGVLSNLLKGAVALAAARSTLVSQGYDIHFSGPRLCSRESGLLSCLSESREVRRFDNLNRDLPIARVLPYNRAITEQICGPCRELCGNAPDLLGPFPASAGAGVCEYPPFVWSNCCYIPTPYSAVRYVR